MASTIFVVDSSPAVRRLVEQISKPEGCDVVGFQDGPAALEAARRMSPNLIIADYHLENMTFSGFCKEVHKLDNLAETYIVSLTSPSDRVDETHLRSLGVKAFLNKPFQSENLIDVIKDLEAQQASRSNGAKKKSRSWPPVSSATDSDDDNLHDDSLTEEEEEQAIAATLPTETLPCDLHHSTAGPDSRTGRGDEGPLRSTPSLHVGADGKKDCRPAPPDGGKRTGNSRGQNRGSGGTHTDGCVSLGRPAGSVLEPLLMTALPKGSLTGNVSLRTHHSTERARNREPPDQRAHRSIRPRRNQCRSHRTVRYGSGTTRFA